jgi:CheY-specific phosphatase CheX
VCKSGLQQALAESAEETLETMFFLSPVDEPDPLPAPAEPQVGAELEFEGDPPGRLSLRVTAAAARSIAADFLGEPEEDLSSGQVDEVICELANIVCGAVLSRVESAAVFRLGPPRIVTPEPPADGAATHRIYIDNGRIDLAIRLKGDAWQGLARSAS